MAHVPPRNRTSVSVQTTSTLLAHLASIATAPELVCHLVCRSLLVKVFSLFVLVFAKLLAFGKLVMRDLQAAAMLRSRLI